LVLLKTGERKKINEKKGRQVSKPAILKRQQLHENKSPGRLAETTRDKGAIGKQRIRKGKKGERRSGWER